MSQSILLWAGCSGLAGLMVTLLLTPLIRDWAVRRRLLDRAGQIHMIHTVAVPRVGGIGFIFSFAAVLLVIKVADAMGRVAIPEEFMVISLTCTAIFIVGFLDDLRPLGARVKLACQIAVAAAAYAGGLRVGQWINPFTQTVHVLGIFDAPLTILWLVGVTNLINLVDGIDGLATGLTFLLFILLGVVGGMAGDFFILLLAVGMASALVGFLYYNFPPAKIFMGDGGAYFLGMLIGEVALFNSHKGEVAAALMVPFFALGLPIIDACFTVIRRGLVGLPLFRADRKHIHHRLVGMGLSQQRVVLLLYAFSIFFALLALGVLVSRGRLLPVFFGIFMVAMVLSVKAFGFIQNWFVLGRSITDAVLRRKHTHYALLLSRLLVLEAERCVSLDELWRQFGFVVDKLGFRAARLRVGAEERRLGPPEIDPSWNMTRLEVRSSPPSELTLYLEPGRWDLDTRHLLGELATEAWTKAAQQWRKIHLPNER